MHSVISVLLLIRSFPGPTGEPIKGLYMAGNTLGGRYGLGNSAPMTGNSIGMAMAHIGTAAKFVAET